MKRNLFFIFSAALLLCTGVVLDSCGDDSDDSSTPTVTPTLRVSGSASINADGNITTNTIGVNATNTDWTVAVKSGSDWLTCSKNGNGVSLTATQNTSSSSREAIILITATADNSLSSTITITQAGATNVPSGTTPTKSQYVTNGALPGVFHVSATKTVHFSQGILEYNPKQNKWRFADEQYIYTNKESYSNITTSSDVWYCKFCWGQSGYNGNSLTSSGYPSSMISMTSIAGTKYDWGIYNSISNGGNKAGLWYCLSADEWNYLITHTKHAYVTIDGTGCTFKTGVILIPDNFVCPDNIPLVVSTDETQTPFDENTNYIAFKANDNNDKNNVFSTVQLTWLESAGAVFLPYGFEWYASTTGREDGKNWLYSVDFNRSYISWCCYGNPKNGRYLVRLVQ